jgi:hypothetical protein
VDLMMIFPNINALDEANYIVGTGFIPPLLKNTEV